MVIALLFFISGVVRSSVRSLLYSLDGAHVGDMRVFISSIAFAISDHDFPSRLIREYASAISVLITTSSAIPFITVVCVLSS